MYWIRLTNHADFDVVTAVNMIGASVKTTENPIGLYGSGVKYALAQALRMGIPIKIASKGKVYTLTGKEQEFRGETFTRVALREQTGKTHVTGITSDFGKEDWNEPWFIFREFYSNMLDEGGTAEIVNGVELSGETDIFLPLAEFREIWINLPDYFTERSWSTRPGTGVLFKKGVRVGQLQGISLDFQGDFNITETRTVFDAEYTIPQIMRTCTDVESWTKVLKSEIIQKGSWYIRRYNEETRTAIRNACKDAKIVFCPESNDIFRDVVYMGYIPVVPPDGMSFEYLEEAELPTYRGILPDADYTEFTPEQAAMVDQAMKKLECFITSAITVKKAVEKSGLSGSANVKTRTIGLYDIAFKSEFELTRVLIHEIGHIESGAGDYDRAFTDFFVRNLADLAL